MPTSIPQIGMEAAYYDAGYKSAVQINNLITKTLDWVIPIGENMLIDFGNVSLILLTFTFLALPAILGFQISGAKWGDVVELYKFIRSIHDSNLPEGEQADNLDEQIESPKSPKSPSEERRLEDEKYFTTRMAEIEKNDAEKLSKMDKINKDLLSKVRKFTAEAEERLEAEEIDFNKFEKDRKLNVIIHGDTARIVEVEGEDLASPQIFHHVSYQASQVSPYASPYVSPDSSVGTPETNDHDISHIGNPKSIKRGRLTDMFNKTSPISTSSSLPDETQIGEEMNKYSLNYKNPIGQRLEDDSYNSDSGSATPKASGSRSRRGSTSEATSI